MNDPIHEAFELEVKAHRLKEEAARLELKGWQLGEQAKGLKYQADELHSKAEKIYEEEVWKRLKEEPTS